MLAPLVSVDSLLGAPIFALAAVVLGWVLAARHISLALLGAMLWAAGAVAALGAGRHGALGDAPLGVVAAAAAAVAIEFAPARARGCPAGGAGRRQPVFASGR